LSEHSKEPDELTSAILTGALLALRKRAAAQKRIDELGTTTAEKHPTVIIRTGEAALAGRIAAALSDCANEFEFGRLE
jgi:hypothetical protein